MCQGCVDDGSITQPVYDMIEAFLKKYPEAEFGPGHITLADCNVEDSNIDFCLQRAANGEWGDTPPATRPIVVAFLQMLRTIPEEER